MNSRVFKSESTILKSFVFLFAIAGLGILDQFSKIFVFNHYPLNMSLAWIGTQSKILLGILPFYNYNFAFSLPLPNSLMYTVYTAALLGIGAYLINHFKGINFIKALPWLFIFVGAFLNFSVCSRLPSAFDFTVYQFFSSSIVT